MLTDSKQDMSWIGLCLLQMAEYLRAVIAESSDKQIKQLQSRIHCDLQVGTEKVNSQIISTQGSQFTVQ